jgi:hypothetical protein
MQPMGILRNANAENKQNRNARAANRSQMPLHDKTPIPRDMLRCLRNAMQMQMRSRVHEEIKYALSQNKQRCIPNVKSESFRRNICS